MPTRVRSQRSKTAGKKANVHGSNLRSRKILNDYKIQKFYTLLCVCVCVHFCTNLNDLGEGQVEVNATGYTGTSGWRQESWTMPFSSLLFILFHVSGWSQRKKKSESSEMNRAIFMYDE